MRAVLVANGPLTPEAEPLLRCAVAESELLIGVDGGARTLLRLGLSPHYVTGDFDSLPDAERAVLRQNGAQLMPTPDQDYTDFDKALTVARETLGVEHATVFGATGGRLDHSYSVFSALIKHAPHTEIKLIDEHALYRFACPSVRFSGDDLPGRTLSLLAFGRAEGVTTTGVRWPLTNEALEPGVRDGTLNIVTEPEVTVSVRSGSVVVMLFHGIH